MGKHSNKTTLSPSNIMYNYLCAAEENPWLAALDIDAANAALAAQRVHCDALVESGEFWELSAEEKSQLSPEVHELVWLDVREAVRACYSVGVKPHPRFVETNPRRLILPRRALDRGGQ